MLLIHTSGGLNAPHLKVGTEIHLHIFAKSERVAVVLLPPKEAAISDSFPQSLSSIISEAPIFQDYVTDTYLRQQWWDPRLAHENW